MSFFGFDTTLPDRTRTPSAGRGAGSSSGHRGGRATPPNGGRGQTGEQNHYGFPPSNRRHHAPDNRETFGADFAAGVPADDEEGLASQLDELLEKKYEYGGLEYPEGEMEFIDDEDTGGLLEDDDEGLNDETFGDSAAPQNINTDFDFTAGNEFFSTEPPAPAVRREDIDMARRASIKELWDHPLPDTKRSEAMVCDYVFATNKSVLIVYVRLGDPRTMQGPQVGGTLTLEEIEAELLRQARGGGMGMEQRNRGVDSPPMMDPRHIDLRGMDLRGIDPRMIDPRLVDPRLLDGGQHLPSLAEMEMALRAQRQRGPNGPPGLGPMPQLDRMGPPMGPPMGGHGHHQQPFRRPLPQLGQFFPNAQRAMYSNQGHRGYDRRGDYSHHQYRHNDRRGYYDKRDREDFRPREEKYKGLMTQREKELIAKIQIAQLVTDDPYSDDFYYQIYSSLISAKGGDESNPGTPPVGGKSLNWQQDLLMRQGRGNTINVTNQMQMQMQRLIDQRKQRPKGTSLALEGALGKLSLSSVRNPKQAIQVGGNAVAETQEAKEHVVPQFARLSHKKILQQIEDVYAGVLELEALKRKGPEGEEEVESWQAEVERLRHKLWEDLGVAQNVPLNMPHPVAYFLSYAKGKRVIPRALRFLTPDQVLAFLSTLLARLEGLDVCNITTGTRSEAVDLFLTHIIPPIVGFISEVPLHVVNNCMRILLERHNLVWLAKTKVGLAFLTMFLSRAEILKQGAGGPGTPGAQGPGQTAPSEAEMGMWADIYNFLFASLHTHFAAIFPIPNQQDGGAAAEADEVYVWQFLAAMAVGATTVDHQRVLLTEVRSKVLEASRRTDNPKSTANVNLFLNALGLGIDASQLANMPA
ncbi:hypothetical protein HDV00_003077 [Rhizophlyctis rosea]|nr:hypothetical protein HDV00_003077 [Rhizophlyctis rosea]